MEREPAGGDEEPILSGPFEWLDILMEPIPSVRKKTLRSLTTDPVTLFHELGPAVCYKIFIESPAYQALRARERVTNAEFIATFNDLMAKGEE